MEEPKLNNFEQIAEEQFAKRALYPMKSSISGDNPMDFNFTEINRLFDDWVPLEITTFAPKPDSLMIAETYFRLSPTQRNIMEYIHKRTAGYRKPSEHREINEASHLPYNKLAVVYGKFGKQAPCKVSRFMRITVRGLEKAVAVKKSTIDEALIGLEKMKLITRGIRKNMRRSTLVGINYHTLLALFGGVPRSNCKKVHTRIKYLEKEGLITLEGEYITWITSCLENTARNWNDPLSITTISDGIIPYNEWERKMLVLAFPDNHHIKSAGI